MPNQRDLLMTASRQAVDALVRLNEASANYRYAMAQLKALQEIVMGAAGGAFDTAPTELLVKVSEITALIDDLGSSTELSVE